MRLVQIKKLRLPIFFSVSMAILVIGHAYWKTKKEDSGPPILDVIISPNLIRIGDTIGIEIHIELPWNQRLLEKFEYEEPAGLQILSAGKNNWPRLNWGKWNWVFLLELQAYDYGPFTDQSVNLFLTPDNQGKNRVVSVPIPDIFVESKLTNVNETIIVATELPKKFLENRTTSRVTVVLMVLTIGCLSATVYCLCCKRKVKKVMVSPKPWDVAKKAIVDLEEGLPLSAETVFVELTDIVRKYIESVYSLPATETTTPEFLEKIKRGNAALSVDHRLLLTDFLTAADLVKFAKVGVTQNQVENAIKKAKKFIVETSEGLIRDEGRRLAC